MNKRLDIKIDNKMKTQITNDWLKEFSSYKKVHPQMLEKRIGPIILAIWYDMARLKIEYKIFGSYFNLSNKSKYVYALLKFEPKTFHCSNIRWERHEQGRYHQAAQELREQAPIPLEGPVTLSQIINAYKNYSDLRYESDNRYFEDPALIAGWAGKTDLAKELLDWGRPFYEKNCSHLEGNKSTEEWYQEMLTKISDPEKLRQTVEEQIIHHKLTKVPHEDLIIDTD